MNLETQIIAHLFDKKNTKRVGEYYIDYLLPDFFDTEEAVTLVNTLRAYHSAYYTVPDLNELKYYHKQQHTVSYTDSIALFYKQLEKCADFEWTPFKEEQFRLRMINFVNNHYQAKEDSVDVKTAADITLKMKWRAKGETAIMDIINGNFEVENQGLITIEGVGQDRDLYASYGLVKGFDVFYPYRKVYAAGSIFTIASMAKGLKSIMLLNLAVKLFKHGHVVIYHQTDTNTTFRIKSALSRILLKKSEEWLMNEPADSIDGEVAHKLSEIESYYENKGTKAKLFIRDGEKRQSVVFKEIEDLLGDLGQLDKPFIYINDQTYFTISKEKQRNPHIKNFENLEHVYRDWAEFLKRNNGIGLDAAHIDTESNKNKSIRLAIGANLPLRGGQSIPNATDLIALIERSEEDIKASTLRFYIKVNRDGATMESVDDCKYLYFNKETLELIEIDKTRYDGYIVDVSVTTNSSADDIFESNFDVL